MQQNIIVLGSTGSIGRNTLEVAQHLKDSVRVMGLGAGKNIELLAQQAHEHQVPTVVIGDENDYQRAKSLMPPATEILVGIQGMTELAMRDNIQTVVCAVVGTAGLFPVLSAAGQGKRIALASKEIMVMAGDFVRHVVAETGVQIIPVDSEHSAIFQCLKGSEKCDVANLILTASGGPFRQKTQNEMSMITPEVAGHHPTWKMGQKITIDSATLMNKALELIEAVYLFNLPESQIKVLIHPQSIIHSMVEFKDNTLLAQLSMPDMKSPIQYALTYPRKMPSLVQPLDLTQIATLSFEQVDHTRFPSLNFAREACRMGRTAPAVLNAANEEAVVRFIRGEIKFTDIFHIVEKTLSAHQPLMAESLDEIISADQWAREYARKI